MIKPQGRLWMKGDRLEGYINLGILGKAEIRMEKNKAKSKNDDADYIIVRKEKYHEEMGNEKHISNSTS